MFSMILVLIWSLLYLRSPYLFIAGASPLYFTGLDSEILDLLVSFPIKIFYFTEELKNGQPPKYPLILTLEFIRWILIWILPLLADVISSYSIFLNAQNRAMAGYTYTALIMIILEQNGKDQKIQVKTKYYFYIGWTLWIIFSLFFQPFNMAIALIIHGLNFIIDFRSVKSH
jgi:hypothetical protein